MYYLFAREDSAVRFDANTVTAIIASGVAFYVIMEWLAGAVVSVSFVDDVVVTFITVWAFCRDAFITIVEASAVGRFAVVAALFATVFFS